MQVQDQFKLKYRKLNQKYGIDPVTYLKIIILLADIGLGLWDETSDVLYLITEETYNDTIYYMLLFFLLASPVVQTLAYVFVFAQIQLQQEGQLLTQDLNDDLAAAKSVLDVVWIFVKLFFNYLGKMLYKGIKVFPTALCVTILQELKIFGPFTIYYIKKNYKVILTQDVISHLRPVILKKRELNKNFSEIEHKKKKLKKIEAKEKQNLQQSINAQNNAQIKPESQKQNQIQAVPLNQQNTSEHLQKSQSQNQDTALELEEETFNNQYQNQALKKQSSSNKSQGNLTQSQVLQQRKQQLHSEQIDEETKHFNKFKDYTREQYIDFHLKPFTFEMISKLNDAERLVLFLDSSMRPNMKTIIEDDNLQQLMTIGNILEAFFESLPQAILQFLNNQMVTKDTEGASWSLFAYLTFATSCFSLTINAIKLIRILIGDKLDVFYSVLTELRKDPNYINSHTQKQEDRVDIVINNQKLLEKLSLADKENLQKIKKIEIKLTGKKNDKMNIIKYCTLICQKKYAALEQIHFDLSKNGIDQVTFKNVLKQQFGQHNIQKCEIIDPQQQSMILDRQSFDQINSQNNNKEKNNNFMNQSIVQTVQRKAQRNQSIIQDIEANQNKTDNEAIFGEGKIQQDEPIIIKDKDHDSLQFYKLKQKYIFHFISDINHQDQYIEMSKHINVDSYNDLQFIRHNLKVKRYINKGCCSKKLSDSAQFFDQVKSIQIQLNGSDNQKMNLQQQEHITIKYIQKALNAICSYKYRDLKAVSIIFTNDKSTLDRIKQNKIKSNKLMKDQDQIKETENEEDSVKELGIQGQQIINSEEDEEEEYEGEDFEDQYDEGIDENLQNNQNNIYESTNSNQQQQKYIQNTPKTNINDINQNKYNQPLKYSGDETTQNKKQHKLSVDDPTVNTPNLKSAEKKQKQFNFQRTISIPKRKKKKEKREITDFNIDGNALFDLLQQNNQFFKFNNFFFDNGLLKQQIYAQNTTLEIKDIFNLKLFNNLNIIDTQNLKKIIINIQKTDNNRLTELSIDIKQQIDEMCKSKGRFPEIQEIQFILQGLDPKYIRYQYEDEIYQNLQENYQDFTREKLTFDMKILENYLTKTTSNISKTEKIYVNQVFEINSFYMLERVKQIQNNQFEQFQDRGINFNQITEFKIYIKESISNPEQEQQLKEFCELNLEKVKKMHFNLTGKISPNFEDEIYQICNTKHQIFGENFKFDSGVFTEYLRTTKNVEISNMFNLKSLSEAENNTIQNIEQIKIQVQTSDTEVYDKNKISEKKVKQAIKIQEYIFNICSKKFPNLRQIKWNLRGNLLNFEYTDQFKIKNGNLPFLMYEQFKKNNKQIGIENFTFDSYIFQEYLTQKKLNIVCIDNVFNLIQFGKIQLKELNLLNFTEVQFNFISQSFNQNQNAYVLTPEEQQIQEIIKSSLKSILSKRFKNSVIFKFVICGYQIEPQFQEKIMQYLFKSSEIQPENISIVMDYPTQVKINTRHVLNQLVLAGPNLIDKIQQIDVKMQDDTYNNDSIKQLLQKLCDKNYNNLLQIQFSLGNMNNLQEVTSQIDQIQLDLKQYLQEHQEFQNKSEQLTNEQLRELQQDENKQQEYLENIKNQKQMLQFSLQVIQEAQQQCQQKIKIIENLQYIKDVVKESEMLCVEQNKIMLYIQHFLKKEYVKQNIIDEFKTISNQTNSLYWKLINKKSNDLQKKHDKQNNTMDTIEQQNEQVLEFQKNVNLIGSSSQQCISNMQEQINNLNEQLQNDSQLGNFGKNYITDKIDTQFKNFKALKHVQALLGGTQQQQTLEKQVQDINSYATNLFQILVQKNPQITVQNFLFDCPLPNYRNPECVIRIYGSKFYNSGQDNEEIVINSFGSKLIANFIASNRYIQNLTIDLEGNDIQDLGLQYLSQGLEQNQIIRQLSLQIPDNKIQNKGIQFLSDAIQGSLKIQTLKLNLNNNEIGYDIIQLCYVIEISKTLHDVELLLMSNIFVDKGCDAVSKMIKKNQSIQRLKINLGFNNITDAAIVNLLGDINENKTLKDLTISFVGNLQEAKSIQKLAKLKENLRYGLNLDITI